MNAIDIIELLMEETNTTLSEIAEYTDLNTKQSVYQVLKQKDMKVGTFCKILECMGYQLAVLNCETDEEFIVDYD